MAAPDGGFDNSRPGASPPTPRKETRKGYEIEGRDQDLRWMRFVFGCGFVCWRKIKISGHSVLVEIPAGFGRVGACKS
jgi:hypothetical protein